MVPLFIDLFQKILYASFMNSFNTSIYREYTGFTAWRNCIRNPRFLIEALLTIFLITLSICLSTTVMHYIHTRPGVVLDDPVQRLIGPVNLRWPVFLVLWSSLLLGMCLLAKTPKRLLLWLQAAAVVTLLRTIALYLVPLTAPPTIIPLADPVATLRTDTGDIITNDLFFSGHTAIMFLLYLGTDNKWLRHFFLIGCMFIGVSVVVQHVHYCGDVFAAPFFAYGSWRFVLFAHQHHAGCPQPESKSSN